MGSEMDKETKLSFAHRLGTNKPSRRVIGSRDVLLGFHDGSTRVLVLDMLWEQPRLRVKGQTLTFFSDLCPITIHKREE